MEDLGLVSASAEDDADHSVTTSVASLSHSSLAVFGSFESLDLPHIRLDVCRLQTADRFDEEIWPQLVVVGRGVFVAVELLGCGGHQELKQKFAVVLAQPPRKPGQALGLPLVQLDVTLRVVANAGSSAGRREGVVERKVPWFPDFVSAVELARVQTRSVGLADPVHQYFNALENRSGYVIGWISGASLSEHLPCRYCPRIMGFYPSSNSQGMAHCRIAEPGDVARSFGSRMVALGKRDSLAFDRHRIISLASLSRLLTTEVASEAALAAPVACRTKTFRGSTYRRQRNRRSNRSQISSRRFSVVKS